MRENINLEKFAGGAFSEKINEALLQVAENIQNPKTSADAKRGITVNIKFQPSKARQIAAVSISVVTKLAPAEAVDTQMVMGINLRTGQMEIRELMGSPGPLVRDRDFDPDTGEIFDGDREDAGGSTVTIYKPAAQF